jgi:hypothetical protein
MVRWTTIFNNLCVCDVKLVTPKESVAIITKGVELGEGGAWGTSWRAWPPPPQCLWVRLRRRGHMEVEAASVPLGEAPRATSPPQAQACPNSTRRRPVEIWPGGRGERGGGCGGCAVEILAPQGRGCFG